MRTSDDEHGLSESTRLAFKLGVTAFGGPAAHIAMLRQEAVERRKWLTDREFLDLLGATNLIPGPNSTEMVMHVGHLRGGVRGMIAAGAAFILPSATITLAIAWLYLRYGTTPEGEWLLYGIKPVVIAVIAQAVWGLARSALTTAVAMAVTAVVFVLYLLGLNELVLLFGVGLGYSVAKLARGRMTAGVAFVPWMIERGWAAATDGVAYSQLRLFFTFLKIGSLLYGSGYVLLAFLRNDFVVRYGWLTEQQLLDAVATGQLTPGPVFTTATFVGYVVAGFSGAVIATIAIFLPAFVFVGLTHPLIRWLRAHATLAALLDGLNLAAIGLMAAIGVQLTGEAVTDIPTALIALGSLVALIRFHLNTTWLIAAGGAFGLLRWWLG